MRRVVYTFFHRPHVVAPTHDTRLAVEVRKSRPFRSSSRINAVLNSFLKKNTFVRLAVCQGDVLVTVFYMHQQHLSN